MLICSPFLSCSLCVSSTMISLQIGKVETQSGFGYYLVVCTCILLDKAILSNLIVHIHLDQTQFCQRIRSHQWADILHQVEPYSLKHPRLYTVTLTFSHIRIWICIFKLLSAYRAEFSQPQHSPAKPKL